MSYSISNRCIRCDLCRPQCPTGAIDFDGEKYTLDSSLCDNCQGYSEPQCIITCPVNSPVPLQAKKGRCKVDPAVTTSPDLFPDGKSHRFASALVVWEVCNILGQRGSLPWQLDESNRPYYQRQIKGDRGSLIFYLTDALGSKHLSTVEKLDIRAACLHLLYAAYAATLEEPWEEEFAIGDRQIEEYLGLDKRKDLTKAAKLTLIKELARQPCQITIMKNRDFLAMGNGHYQLCQSAREWDLLRSPLPSISTGRHIAIADLNSIL